MMTPPILALNSCQALHRKLASLWQYSAGDRTQYSNSFLSWLISSQSLPSLIMALQITSAIILSPSSSLNCINDFPKPPLSALTRPSKAASVIRQTTPFLHLAHIRQCLLPKLTINISLPTLSTSHVINQNDPFIWEKTFRGQEQGHDTSESWHETQHSLTSHYVKIPHYHITCNHSHQTTSLIQRRVMS